MAARTGVRRHNVIRFTWRDEKDVFLSRLDFSRQIIQKLLEVKPEELNCLIKCPGTAVCFEVSFVSTGVMKRCLELYKEKKKEPPLSQFLVEPLSDREIKVVTIQFYRETVTDYDIETWLHRHCKVKSGSRKVKDADGVWNGARQWLIQLYEDPNGIDGVRHLPSNFTLGTARGFVMYYGMPKLCRNCGGWGHLAAACKITKCKNCGGPHISSMCREEKKCNLCGKEGHVFKTCPDLYTNVLKRKLALRPTVVEEESNEESRGNNEAQIGNEEESLEEYSSSSDESLSEFECEEEGTTASRERRKSMKRKPEQDNEVDIMKKKVGEVSVFCGEGSGMGSGGMPEDGDEGGNYVDSPASSSLGEDVVRADFEGAAFLEEKDMASFSIVSAIMKSVEDKAVDLDKTAVTEEVQMPSIESKEEESSGKIGAVSDADKLGEEGVGIDGVGISELDWKMKKGKKDKKRGKKKDVTEVQQ